MEQRPKLKPLSNWLVVIPARLESARLPQKLIQDVCGEPLIVRTYNNLKILEHSGATILVAVDSSEIENICKERGINCIVTGQYNSGTDRCNAAARAYPEKTHILNVQGDEPLVNTLDLINMMKVVEGFNVDMGTLIYSSIDMEDAKNPNVVKTVRDERGYALYFSRSHIPHGSKRFWHHIGVYAFSRKALHQFCAHNSTSLERAEKLEQLRALQMGLKIKTFETFHKTIGVDTADDLEKVKKFF
jgi:3-deoxy-manno-octulosonate cytidylyltransferase (CMP-KDO synthetase)